MVTPVISGYKDGQPIYSSASIDQMNSDQYNQWLAKLANQNTPQTNINSSITSAMFSDYFPSYYFRGTPESEALNRAYGDLYTQTYSTKQQNLQDPRYTFLPSEPRSFEDLTDWQRQRAFDMGINPNQTNPTLLALWMRSIGTQPGSAYKTSEDYQRFAAPYLQQMQAAQQQEAQRRAAEQAKLAEQQRQQQEEKVSNRLYDFYRQAAGGLGRSINEYLYGPPSRQEQTMNQVNVLLNSSGIQWREEKLRELERMLADPTYRPARMDLYGQYINNPAAIRGDIQKFQSEISDAYANAQKYVTDQINLQNQLDERQRMQRSRDPNWDNYVEQVRASNARYAKQQEEENLRKLQDSVYRGMYTSPGQGFQTPYAYQTWGLSQPQTAVTQATSPMTASYYQRAAQQMPTGPAATSPATQPANQLPMPTRPYPGIPSPTPQATNLQRPYKPRPGFPQPRLPYSTNGMGV